MTVGFGCGCGAMLAAGRSVLTFFAARPSSAVSLRIDDGWAAGTEGRTGRTRLAALVGRADTRREPATVVVASRRAEPLAAADSLLCRGRRGVAAEDSRAPAGPDPPVFVEAAARRALG